MSLSEHLKQKRKKHGLSQVELAERILTRMAVFQPQRNALIEASFLPEDLREAYKDLIRKRLQTLNADL